MSIIVSFLLFSIFHNRGLIFNNKTKREGNMYWLTYAVLPVIIIVILNLLLYKLTSKLKYLFSILPVIITLYFFVGFLDSPHSMEGVYEFIWGATSFGVGIISFLLTKLTGKFLFN
jgi:hypothetical protein